MADRPTRAFHGGTAHARRSLPPARKAGEEGMALILVLLFIVLLTAIIIEYGYENRVEATFVESTVADFEAEVAAKSAVSAGLSLLSADLNLDVSQYLEGNQVDSFQDAWAMGIAYRPINKAVMQCLIDDEYGKINLNALLPNGGAVLQDDSPLDDSDTVPVGPGQEPRPETFESEQPNEYLEAALRALFAMRGAEDDPVDAILDWIDADEESRTDGAENDYYGSLDVAYACKNGPLSSVEELLLIKGITPEIFFGDPNNDEVPLTEILTVRGSRRGDINVNTAERETLEAFGEAFGMQNFAESIIEERMSSPFTSPEDLQSRGVSLPTDEQVPDSGNSRRDDGRRDEEARELGMSAAPTLICNSRVFRIRGTGTSGDAAVQIEAYVSRNASSFSTTPIGEETDDDDNDDTNGDRRRDGAGLMDRDFESDNSQSGGQKTFALLDWRVLR